MPEPAKKNVGQTHQDKARQGKAIVSLSIY